MLLVAEAILSFWIEILEARGCGISALAVPHRQRHSLVSRARDRVSFMHFAAAIQLGVHSALGSLHSCSFPLWPVCCLQHC